MFSLRERNITNEFLTFHVWVVLHLCVELARKEILGEQLSMGSDIPLYQQAEGSFKLATNPLKVHVYIKDQLEMINRSGAARLNLIRGERRGVEFVEQIAVPCLHHKSSHLHANYCWFPIHFES